MFWQRPGVGKELVFCSAVIMPLEVTFSTGPEDNSALHPFSADLMIGAAAAANSLSAWRE
jgi:hypothetical protein